MGNSLRFWRTKNQVRVDQPRLFFHRRRNFAKMDGFEETEPECKLKTSFYLGKTTTSPRRIYELAKDHEMNGQSYHATHHNCQKWALELLKKVDEKIYLKAKEGKSKPIPIQERTMISSSRVLVLRVINSPPHAFYEFY